MNANITNAILEAATTAIEIILRTVVAPSNDRWDDAVTVITAQMVSKLRLSNVGYI